MWLWHSFTLLVEQTRSLSETMKQYGILLTILILCRFPLVPLWATHAHPAPLLLQERYLMATIDAPLRSEPTFDLDFSIFNGDFPLLFQANASEFSLYTGSPYYFPVFLSIGSINQVGYMDPYRTKTLLSTASLGYRHNLFAAEEFHLEGFFTTWGWRYRWLSGGISYHIEERVAIGYVGISFANFSTSLMLSPQLWEVSFTLRSGNTWSLLTSLTFDEEGGPSLTIGAGISRRDIPADSLHEAHWDMLIAHRGSLQHAPENTLSAFNWAIGQPQFIGIETDVRQTADGNFVLVHDASLARYEHGFIDVATMTTDELKSLDMGTWFDDEFSGARVMDVRDLAQVANANPDIYWLLEIKDVDWTEEDAFRFLSIIDKEFLHHDKVVFYVVDERMLPIMKSITTRPVGLQLDTVKNMLFYSDHLLPLVDEEMERHLGMADFFTILSSKYDRDEEMEELAESLDIPVMYWNFHDTIFGYIPKTRKRFPLGMPTIEKGSVIKEGYIPPDER